MSTDNKGEWKEFDEFYSAHELQLFGMSFPRELAEKLYFKLKNEIFDMNNFFEIMDNPNEQRYLLRTKKEIKKNDHVFLVDHAWTYRLRQYSEFCKTYPTLIKRCTTMLKYGAVKKDVINLQQTSSQNDVKKDLNTYNNELVVNNKYEKLDYDEYDITDDTFESSVKVNENTILAAERLLKQANALLPELPDELQELLHKNKKPAKGKETVLTKNEVSDGIDISLRPNTIAEFFDRVNYRNPIYKSARENGNIFNSFFKNFIISYFHFIPNTRIYKPLVFNMI
jgi:hypothetical protein